MKLKPARLLAPVTLGLLVGVMAAEVDQIIRTRSCGEVPDEADAANARSVRPPAIS